MSNHPNMDRESREGVIFYRRRIGDWIRRYIIELVIIALVLAFIITSTVITTGARSAFREAKDVRMALKFVGTQYFGENSSIFDKTKTTGLRDGAAEDIADISTRKGEVVLYAWDDKANEPLMFEYRKGSYTVIYIADTYTGKTDEDGKVNHMMGRWEIKFSINVLTYDTE
ncbi:MAG: hypothetical protein K6E60_05900 [Saccharofermentans sp.]|nr:hypothetical protein [Saccharofermentans sp.]